MDRVQIWVWFVIGLSTLTLADDCSSVQIPIIQDVFFDNTTRSPLAVAIVTIRTQHKLLDYEFYVIEETERNSMFPASSNDAYSLSKESTSEDYILKLLANRNFHELSLTMDFDLAGCNRIEMFIGLREPVSVGQYKPLNLGQFVDLTPPSQLVEPGKIYRIKFAMNTNLASRLDVEMVSYRNISGLVENSYERLGRGPFDFSTDRSSGPGEDPVISAWFEWPAGVYDVVFKTSPEIDLRRVAPLRYVMVNFYTNMHTDDRLPAIVKYHSCTPGPDFRDPEEENGVVKVWTQANDAPCLSVSLFGNPLPEVALAEMAGAARVEKLIDLAPNFQLTETYDNKYFFVPTVIDNKQELQCVLAVKDHYSGEITFTDVVFIGHRPFQFLTDFEVIDATSPRNITLQCKVSGPFRKIGFYFIDENIYRDSRKNTTAWQTLEEFATPSDDGGEFEYDLVLTEDLLEDIRNYDVLYFCGAVEEYGIHVHEYSFNTYGL